ncbi:MAG: OmpH family outer membrane protein [Planctomycetes bacterium]|nr:OmpH family outer membrane protein [Planctomycetota bacterium]
MKASRIVFVVAAAVAAALLMFADTNAQPPAAPKAGKPTVVAVCDIDEVNKNYKKTQDLVGISTQRIKDLEKEFKARGEKLDALRNDLAVLKAGSPQYEKAIDDLQKQAIELEAWRKFQEAIIMRDKFRLTKEVYEDVVKAVGDVARSRGVQIVLYRSSANIDSRDLNDLIGEMDRRKILYWDSDVDITNEVLTQVNQNYTITPPRK